MNNRSFMVLLGLTILVSIGVYFMTNESAVAPSEEMIAIDEELSKGASDEAAIEVSATTTESPVSVPAKAAPVKTTAPTVPAKASTPQTSSVVLFEAESGSLARIATARLAESGYIVIYLTNNKEQTRLIGRSDLLPAGSYTNLRIQLSSPISWKQVVTAVLHTDDGDEKFEFPVSDSYMKNGTRLVYDEEVVDVPIVEETGLVNGTVEDHLESAKQALIEE